MNRQERLVALAVLGLIGLGIALVSAGKPRLGNPGLAMEKAPLTNEVGALVRDERVRLPENVQGFKSKDAPITTVEVKTLPPDTIFGRKLYWDQEGFGVQMSAVMMRTDRTSIHRPEICMAGGGWNIQKSEIIDIPVALPAPYVLKATCLTSRKTLHDAKTNTDRPRSSIYIYWFVSEYGLIPTHSEVLWAISKDLLSSGVLYPWAYVSCYSDFPPGNEGIALARMKRLISEAVPQFQLIPAGSKQTASLEKAGSLQ